ncbi:hypothetical protein R9X49_20665 [Pectobacterium carotovorum]|uniref:hypothetical protein n=1 Tax=Pectobacterium carotovorum TaxID=554 RepID=UPI0029DCD25F|nr:hypothetical protein [Pectobacterium carotovorum]MDX6917526.1 hypothetical protein [Pectobacterium carotovorum]
MESSAHKMGEWHYLVRQFLWLLSLAGACVGLRRDSVKPLSWNFLGIAPQIRYAMLAYWL